MNLQNVNLNVNYLVNEITTMTRVPESLHLMFNALRNITKVDLVKLYTEATMLSLPKLLKKYDVSWEELDKAIKALKK